MQVIYGGDDAFAASICGIQNPVNRNYFMQEIENARSLVGDAFGTFGRKFVEGAQNLFERFNSDRAIEIAKAALNQVTGIFQADIIRNIQNLSSFQIATPVMQRWVMANPVVRELYHDQKCDGYSESYVDLEPGKIGPDHYDWRRVNNGAVQFDEQGNWYADQYAEELRPGDEELSTEDQFRIRNTWHNLEQLLFQSMKDPTSIWNNDL